MEWTIKVFLLCITFASSQSNINMYIPKEVHIIMPRMVEQYGYIVNEYSATTDDGYILKIFRMRKNENTTQSLPILLIHGIVGSAEDYLRMGPDRSLGYLLADNGYDVWLGNLRGNLYTSHITLDKNDYSFWNFSFDEHGMHDVPTMVEKVISVTGSPKLHYIGYSMGTTSYFIACNKRPDVMKSVATFVALAPVTSLGPTPRFVANIALQFGVLEILKDLKVGSILYNDFLQRLLALTFCSSDNNYNNICYAVTFFITGRDYEQIDRDKTLEIFMKLQPATMKQLEHYGQVAMTGTLSAFDWGAERNMIAYGKEKPPEYDLTMNKVPTALIYGLRDSLSVPAVTNRLSRKLKSKVPMLIRKLLPYKKFNHFDFVYSKDVKSLVNDYVIEMIPKLYKATNGLN